MLPDGQHGPRHSRRSLHIRQAAGCEMQLSKSASEFGNSWDLPISGSLHHHRRTRRKALIRSLKSHTRSSWPAVRSIIPSYRQPDRVLAISGPRISCSARRCSTGIPSAPYASARAHTPIPDGSPSAPPSESETPPPAYPQTETVPYPSSQSRPSPPAAPG